MSATMPGDELRAVLKGEHKGLSDNRRFLRRLPSPPRCELADLVHQDGERLTIAPAGLLDEVSIHHRPSWASELCGPDHPL